MAVEFRSQFVKHAGMNLTASISIGYGLILSPHRFLARGTAATSQEVAAVFAGLMMKANVYVDGFNFYYGSLKGTRYKWLDLLAMCRRLLPDRRIERIRFFTAPIMAQPHNLLGPERQDAYLSAIQTIPNLSVHLGRFSVRPAFAPAFPLVYPVQGDPPLAVRILKTEEKRTDVNLATLLLMDCVDDDFEEAVVISNDSDLMLPIEYAVKRFGKIVGVVNPHRRSKFSGELVQAASWSFKEINRSVLAASQFPSVITGARGQITKPATW